MTDMSEQTDIFPLSELPDDVRASIRDEELFVSATITHRDTYVILTYADYSTTLAPDDVIVYKIVTASYERATFKTTYAAELIHKNRAYDALSTALEAVAASHRESYAVFAENDPGELDRRDYAKHI